MTDDKLRAALGPIAHDPLGCNGPHVELESAIRALAASATEKGPTFDIESARDRVISAMPWYDESNPDYTELDAVLTSLARPAVPVALDVEAVKAALPRWIGDDKAWEWADGTVARTQDEKANVIAAKISEYAALHSKEPTE